MKKYVFLLFFHFNNFFGTHGHIPAIFNLLDLREGLKKTCIFIHILWIRGGSDDVDKQEGGGGPLMRIFFL